MSDSKLIYCDKCGRYCGEIRKAILIKGLTYICPTCGIKNDKCGTKKQYDDIDPSLVELLKIFKV